MTQSYNLGPDNIEVFSETEIVWMGAAVEGETVRYVPVAMADGRMGYCVCSLSGDQQEFLYLKPSTEDLGPCAFVYQGVNNGSGDVPLQDVPRLALPGRDAGTRFEFEAVCDATVRETWRVVIPGADGMSDTEIADRIEDEMAGGNCEFVSEKAEDETNRNLQRATVERL
jgi:hypothetical protein